MNLGDKLFWFSLWLYTGIGGLYGTGWLALGVAISQGEPLLVLMAVIYMLVCGIWVGREMLKILRKDRHSAPVQTRTQTIAKPNEPYNDGTGTLLLAAGLLMLMADDD